MNRIIMALALSLACAPALAQDSDAPAPADTTPAPSADCTTLDCNSNRQQQDNLNNNSGTPSARIRSARTRARPAAAARSRRPRPMIAERRRQPRRTGLGRVVRRRPVAAIRAAALYRKTRRLNHREQSGARCGSAFCVAARHDTAQPSRAIVNIPQPLCHATASPDRQHPAAVDFSVVDFVAAVLVLRRGRAIPQFAPTIRIGGSPCPTSIINSPQARCRRAGPTSRSSTRTTSGPWLRASKAFSATSMPAAQRASIHRP